MVAKIINGRKIAQKMKDDIALDIQSLLKKTTIQPIIATIIIGHDPGSELYLKLRDAACHDVGIKSHHVRFEQDVSEQTVLRTIHSLNSDTSIHGILIQYPVPQHISSYSLMSAIDPTKDVEGLHPYNLGNILLGEEQIIPCTPAAILAILDHEHVTLEGLNVALVNHSIIVGKPLSLLLLNRNVSLSVYHVFTKDLINKTQNADVLISAVGKPQIITKEHIKKNAFVIDVGICPTKKGIVGDVSFDEVQQKAAKITPVPGGVGPVTIVCSLQNMVKTYKRCLL